MSHQDYVNLQKMMATEGWRVLESIWLAQVGDIEDKRDLAAKKGQESAWRYWAGLEKGFKLAILQSKIALEQMEKDEDNLNATDRYDELLQQVRGEKQP